MKKYNLLIPIAGMGSRFVKENYFLPKPLILIDERSIIEWTMDSIDYSECNLIFIVRTEHVINFNIDGYLKNRFGNDITIIETDKVTEGAVCSCLLAEAYIDNNEPLIIHCSDVYFKPKFKPVDDIFETDGCILTFKSNSINYSYIETDQSGIVIRTAEKQVISSDAAVGVYCFKHGSDFIRLARQMIKRNLRTNNEFYICPIYNLFVEEGKIISTMSVDKMHVFGTPDELNFFINNSLRTWPKNKTSVALCSDHSGYEVKEKIKTLFKSLYPNVNCIDFGVYDKRTDRDYFEYVSSAAEAIIKKYCSFGMGSCRSGQGINICANKIKGIRSAWVMDGYLAEYAIRHNCSNFFSIPANYVSDEKLNDIIKSIMMNTFDGGRHQVRISKLEK